MSIREDEENQEVDIPEEIIEVSDVDLDLEDGEEPMIDDEETE